MKACRTASIVAAGALFTANAIGACREKIDPEIPPVTVARPDGPRVLGPTTATIASDAALGDDASASMLATPLLKEPPIKASFVDAPGKVDAQICSRVLIAVVKGKITAMGETLAAGDVLVLTYPDPVELTGAGLAVVARRDLDLCAILSRPAIQKKVVRGTTAPKLEWAGGAMNAHLDVAPPANDAGAAVSPELYLGRLEGTSAVAEHTHAGSWEILAAVEANGTFVIDGTEGRLAARQIVMVPPGAKHAWKPEPGSKLVAIQMYSPPGPEQRFVTLAAAAVKDASPH